jgi:hypothetical protein
LYDGVADTLVSQLLRNAQQLLAKNSRFPIDSSFVEDEAPTNTNVQWTRAPIGVQCIL